MVGDVQERMRNSEEEDKRRESYAKECMISKIMRRRIRERIMVGDVQERIRRRVKRKMKRSMVNLED